MKQKFYSYFAVVVLMLSMLTPAKAWLTTAPPIAGFTGITDGQTFTAPFIPTSILGYATKIASPEGTPIGYYTIDTCRDLNEDGKIDEYEISRGMAFRTIVRIGGQSVGWTPGTEEFVTPGDLLDGQAVVWLGKGWWFLRIRAVDVNGNTTTEVQGIDQYFQQGAGIAVTPTGNSTYGWTDEAVVLIKVQ